MQFSAMTMNMFVPDNDDPGDDTSIIDMAVANRSRLAELGYHVWFTDHHFRGPWPQATACSSRLTLRPLITPERYMARRAFHPVLPPGAPGREHEPSRSVAKGKVLFGVGRASGRAPSRPARHRSGASCLGPLAEETLDCDGTVVGFPVRRPGVQLFGRPQQLPYQQRRVMPATVLQAAPPRLNSRCERARRASSMRHGKAGRPFSASSAPTCAIRCNSIGVRSEEAGHPPEVKDNCLRWCHTTGWASRWRDTDEEALVRETMARAERWRCAAASFGVTGRLDGPVIKSTPGQSTADA